jgi:hypothetical protein
VRRYVARVLPSSSAAVHERLACCSCEAETVLSRETVRAIRSHAGRDADGGASIAHALARGRGVDAARADVLGTRQQLNAEMNGSDPSEGFGDEDALPRSLVYAVAEVRRMLRDERHDEDAWAVDTDWLAVLAGDVDDIAEHVELERAARG